MANLLLRPLRTVCTKSTLDNVLTKRTFRHSTRLRDMFSIQDKDDFSERVLKSKTPVLVDFHASWCGPCKMLGPRLETIVAASEGKIHLAKVDVDDNTDLAMDYNVTAVPAVVAIKDGEIIDRFVGVQDEDKIQTIVDKVIGPV